MPLPPYSRARGLHALWVCVRDAGRRVAAAESGLAAVWVALMLPLLLSVVGVAADGGLVFDTRVELQNVVDGAARAGTTQLDVGLYRQSGGKTVALDAGRADRAARDYLAAQRIPLAGVAVAVDAQVGRVIVQAAQQVPTAFVRVVGLDSIRVAVTGTAEVRYGVERAQA